MDAGQEEDSLHGCSERFLAEVGAEIALDDSSPEGTDESSSDEEDVFVSAASSRSGLSACQVADSTESRPVRTHHCGQLMARMGPMKLRFCRAGKVNLPKPITAVAPAIM